MVRGARRSTPGGVGLFKGPVALVRGQRPVYLALLTSTDSLFFFK